MDIKWFECWLVEPPCLVLSLLPFNYHKEMGHQKKKLTAVYFNMAYIFQNATKIIFKARALLSILKDLSDNFWLML